MGSEMCIRDRNELRNNSTNRGGYMYKKRSSRGAREDKVKHQANDGQNYYACYGDDHCLDDPPVSHLLSELCSILLVRNAIIFK